MKSRCLSLVEYLALRVSEKILLILPQSLRYLLGRELGRLIYFLAPSLREETLKGLLTAYAREKSRDEINKIRKKCFTHLGAFIIEILGMAQYQNGRLSKAIRFSEKSLEIIETLHSRGRGIICLSAHYGNWELLALVIARLDYSLNIVYRPLDNELIDRYINTLRINHPSRLIPRDKAYRKGSEVLSKNEIVALLVDQNQSVNGVFVPFFGKLASTAKGAAILARRTHASVMGAYIQRNPDFTHTVTFREIEVIDTSSSQEYIYRNTHLFTCFFENVIREAPEQWFWFHPRWKTRPVLEEFPLT
ncbi:MAG: acyltransferase [bacterium]|nr:MAG: acyltransferase [bacterium]